jgi:tetratricopeptide (TPR) repeat protein
MAGQRKPISDSVADSAFSKIYHGAVAEGGLMVGTDPDSDGLLPMALSRPREALARARRILAGRPAPALASVAHQAAGVVLREFGDVRAGLAELRTALRLARQTGSVEREADVLAALGIALVYTGRTTAGLADLNRAFELASGTLAGRVLHRRGVVLLRLGQYAAALDDLSAAVVILQRDGDRLWAARALNARGLTYLDLGSPALAAADFHDSGLLYAQTGQELEAVQTVHNRGWAAICAGDLPAAIALLDEAAARFRPLNVPMPSLSIDRCNVFLAAGLTGDALAEADAAIDTAELGRGPSSMKAQLLLTGASCALAAAQPQTALDRARAASRFYRTQGSAWGQAYAGLVLAQARYAAGPASGSLLRAAAQAADALAALGAQESAQARLLAGRVALDLGRREEADRHLGTAAESRGGGTAMARATGWLAEALAAQAAGDPRRLLRACRRGLAALDEHRLTLGATEMRAQATAHGAELAALAQRHAAQARRPRLLLAWSERWRATALAVPAVRRPPGAELDAELAALRRVTGQLETAQREGAPAEALQREQRRLETAVRARVLRTRGAGGPGSTSAAGGGPGTGGPAAASRAGGWPAGADVGGLLDQLGETALLEIVDVDGILHVLACYRGRVRQFPAGAAADAVRAGEFARFALHRLARARPADNLGSAQAILAAAGPRLQDALLGPAAAVLGDGPAVIVPPGRLHTVPWALLPALADRAFSVAPSAGAWLRAQAAPPPGNRHVILARGPGLVTGGAEVPAVADLYDDATVLGGAQATAARVLSALDGAWLGHIAAHGSFRADSPLFSALHMHDGPLTVYDFEQLQRAPYRLILSSCDSGVLAPAGADELLGLVSSLLPLGTAGIIAGVVPLNDYAVVPLMVNLHRRLRTSPSLAQALHGARRDAAGDPLEHAAALSLVALGAA